MIKSAVAFLLILFCSALASAQEEQGPAQEEQPPAPQSPAPAFQSSISFPANTERSIVKLHDFQTVLVSSLRQQFPRLQGMFSVAHSCRLPEYGPVISLTLQLPALYFTRPLLQELEKQSRIAEEQARRYRSQIERTAELVRLRARESELSAQIQNEFSTKRKAKVANATLQAELDEVRKNMKELESGPSFSFTTITPEQMSEVDLEKMLAENYQQLLQRITTSVRSVLAEKAPSLADVRADERITVTAHIRESFVSAQERSIIFTLRYSDIESYRNGTIDLEGLKEKIEVRNESRDPSQQ